jgi:uncharacterized membrane protein
MIKEIPMTNRIKSLDLLRGIIMILMALDHAVLFVTKNHAYECWGREPPVYQNVLYFITRFSSHFCAPGFFFLMGVSMVLFAVSRRNRGWSELKIMRYFLIRGLLLIVIQQLIVNSAWYLGTMGRADFLGASGPPGGYGQVWFLMDVLYGLGMTMIVLSFLLRIHPVVLAIGSLAAILAVQLLIPDPAQVDVLYAPWLRLLLIPGQTNMLLVNYPLMAWVGVAGLGVVFGKMLQKNRPQAFNFLFVFGVSFLAIFVVLRLAGLGDFHPRQEGGMGFLNLTKYPPSLDFILLTLGVNFILLYFLEAVSNHFNSNNNPLLIFGQSALFFYIVHLFIYAMMGFTFSKGIPFVLVYPVWGTGLILLYPLCRWYSNFKMRKKQDSVWRFF